MSRASSSTVATTEGPSSPVPDDLLRLSIGLEATEDLIADLEAALSHVSKAGGPGAVAAYQKGEPLPQEADPTGVVAAAVERCIAPLIVARGGGIRIVAVNGGMVTLEASGSPGAVLPLRSRLTGLLQSAVPTVKEVRLIWPEGDSTPDGWDDISSRVRSIIDQKVNPAVAAHGGRVSLVGVDNGHVRIQLEGGCQGCSLCPDHHPPGDRAHPAG